MAAVEAVEASAEDVVGFILLLRRVNIANVRKVAMEAVEAAMEVAEATAEAKVDMEAAAAAKATVSDVLPVARPMLICSGYGGGQGGGGNWRQSPGGGYGGQQGYGQGMSTVEMIHSDARSLAHDPAGGYQQQANGGGGYGQQQGGGGWQ